MENNFSKVGKIGNCTICGIPIPEEMMEKGRICPHCDDEIKNPCNQCRRHPKVCHEGGCQ